jgi:hypothetical protein
MLAPPPWWELEVQRQDAFCFRDQATRSLRGLATEALFATANDRLPLPRPNRKRISTLEDLL